MTTTEIPIACTLTSEQLQERRSTLLEPVSQAVLEVQEREQGYAYRFPANMLEALFQVIRLEHQCCAFLRFTLTVEPGDGPLWLEVAGPEGTKELLAAFL